MNSSDTIPFWWRERSCIQHLLICPWNNPVTSSTQSSKKSKRNLLLTSEFKKIKHMIHHTVHIIIFFEFDLFLKLDGISQKPQYRLLRKKFLIVPRSKYLLCPLDLPHLWWHFHTNLLNGEETARSLSFGLILSSYQSSA